MLAEIPAPRGFGNPSDDGGMHCPRAFRRSVTESPYLVGYCRWDGRSDRVVPVGQSHMRLHVAPIRTSRRRGSGSGISPMRLPHRLRRRLFGAGVVGSARGLRVFPLVRDQSPACIDECYLPCGTVQAQDRNGRGRRYVVTPGEGVVVMRADVPKALDRGFFWGDVAATHARHYRRNGRNRGRRPANETRRPIQPPM